ncbi:hypothetical protein GCM10023210_40450 [Chryseobacterium ginsengisoli]|uniref:Lipoprotein n=2 Tax=Chryseobacterium ginsengisoli TaxID=363853 RepID=A0ABP9MVF9_9FLAO
MMKNIFSIILFILLISCGNKKHKENQELILTANAIKTTNNSKELKIQIKLTNNSESVKSYSIMSCSYSDNFVLGNSALLISPIECDKNFPARLILNPNQSKTHNLTILKIRASKTEDFKIGFKIIKIQDNSNYFDEYEKQIKDPNIKIVWSNPVKIQ